MANPQVCNVATIGGNVAHALPAADGTISLLALDAQAEVANPNGRRKFPLQALFKGPGESTLDPGRDLLVGFYLPLQEKGPGIGICTAHQSPGDRPGDREYGSMAAAERGTGHRYHGSRSVLRDPSH